MIVPYSVDVPMQRLPFANWAILVLTAIVSFYVTGSLWLQPNRPATEGNPMTEGAPPSDTEPYDFRDAMRNAQANIAGTRHIPLALYRGERFAFYQVITHPFVHSNIFHFFFNAMFLFAFGNAVNAKLGHRVFVAAYAVGQFATGILWLIFGSDLPLAGMSGGLVTVIGLFIVLYPKNAIQVFMLSISGFGSYHFPSAALIILYYLGNIIGASHGAGYVGHLLHWAVTFGAMAFGVVWLLRGQAAPTEYEQNLLQALGYADKRGRWVGHSKKPAAAQKTATAGNARKEANPRTDRRPAP